MSSGFTFQNLPGVQVVTVDGGMAAVNTPTTKSALIVGTSNIGPANSPYQVVSAATAASTFGLNGTLVRAMSEVGAYCDNIFLYRIGTAPGTFTVGATASGSESFTPTSSIWSSGVATISSSTTLPDDFVVGATVVLSGYTPGAWNGSYTITALPSTMSFKIAIASDPGTESIEGTATVTVVNNSGITITLGQIDSSASTRYQVWYNAGIVSLWLDQNLVYSNDPTINVNTGDSTVSGTATGGLPLNNSVANNPDTLANSITIAQAIALSGNAEDLVPSYTAPITGVGMTARQTYIAQQNAFGLLQGFPVDFVVVPNVIFDNPSIAYYVSSNSATGSNNPATNSSALGWLWTGQDVLGNPIYQWANEALFWNYQNQSSSTATLLGQSSPTTATVQSFSMAGGADRLAAGVGSSNLQQNGFHEVSFGYQLARFCAAQSEAPQATNAGTIGFIGTSGPANLSNFSLPAVRAWIGFAPTYNPISPFQPITPGSGLLGIAYLNGTTAAMLNISCADQPSGYRLSGFHATSSGEYDGSAQTDANGYPVDIGAYLHVAGDYVLMTNSYGQYVSNIASMVAGLVSSLDQKSACTNKPIAGMQQLYRATLNQLDALTDANINVMRYTGPGNLPVCLHDKTAANDLSDYTLMLRQRIKFLVIQTLLQEAENFIGNGTNDGLQLTALQTAVNADAANLQKRGYLSSYVFTITSTASQQKLGQASIQINFVPANELVQLRATIGINLNS